MKKHNYLNHCFDQGLQIIKSRPSIARVSLLVIWELSTEQHLSASVFL